MRAYVESDNGARAVYVVAVDPDGVRLRIDAPSDLITSDRFAWCRSLAASIRSGEVDPFRG